MSDIDLTEYLADGKVIEGEQRMHCPLHEDDHPSASINFEKGVWNCFAACGGGSIEDLKDRIENSKVQQVNPNGRVTSISTKQDTPYIPAEIVEQYEHALLSSERLMGVLEERGVGKDISDMYEIGWSSKDGAFSIPIRDSAGKLVNIRFYVPTSMRKPGQRKVWSFAKGTGTARLWPLDSLRSSEVLVCEGEIDTLVALTKGFSAITSTTGAKTWSNSWSASFAGKDVVIVYDTDDAGVSGAHKVSRSLKRSANSVKVLHLPHPEGSGKDISDYFLDHSASDLRSLIGDARDGISPPKLVSVTESFSSGVVNKPISLDVTVVGKHWPTSLVPQDVTFTCAMDAGAKCSVCPMASAGGLMNLDVNPDDPMLLKFLGKSEKLMADVLRERIGAVKCGRMDTEINESHAVERLVVRASVDSRDEAARKDFTSRLILSVGRADTDPNTLVRISGHTRPDPYTAENVMQVHEIERMQSSMDKFKMSPELKEELSIFQDDGRNPLTKMSEIADAMEAVTHIHHRTRLHMLYDLSLHSAIAFDVFGQRVHRGWVELLVVGDTRTGKSEAADRMLRWYQAGTLVSCESASFAGIIGGVAQYGNRDWVINWGLIPQNDLRAVVLDEVSGLTTEQISAMSSVRSSGLAEITKIKTEQALARARLIWLANPRDGKRIRDYPYGMSTIRPLIGNMEDISRFDIATVVASTDVMSSEINAMRDLGEPRYGSELCHNMVMWAWSRQPHHIFWSKAAERQVMKDALQLGDEYVESPPLIQGASVRFKIARIATAIAMRTFSTDKTGEKVLVGKRHAKAAAELLRIVYKESTFGYNEHSKRVKEREQLADKNRDDLKKWLYTSPDLTRFLQGGSAAAFRRSDMEDFMNVDRGEASAIINRLSKMGMVRREGQEVVLEPVALGVLREVRS